MGESLREKLPQVYRLPNHAARLPVFLRERSKPPLLLPNLAFTSGPQHTRGGAVLVHIQPTTARITGGCESIG